MTATARVDSWYSRTALDDRPRPPLAGEVEVDTCVVGGGLAGLNTLLGLAERGRTAVLLEARRIAWGASGRNGGFVSAGWSLGPAAIVARVGPDAARELMDLALAGLALIRARIRRHDIDCGPVIDGYLKVQRRHRPEAARRHQAFMQRHFGRAPEYWPRERVRELLRSALYHDALYDPDAFQFHPLNYSLGVARAAEGSGARIHEDTPATELARADGGWRVSTPDGAVRARHVVLACGGYTDGLVPRLRGAIVPVATSVMTTAPLGDRLETAIRTRIAISDTRLAGNYYRALADGRIMWGGRMTAWTRDPGDLAGLMRRDMLSVYPQLAGAVRTETAWSGLMGYARHQMPQIGRLPDGLWYVTAFGGHGMCPTTVGGELVAAAIAEGDDRWRLFASFGLDRTWGLAGAAAAQASYTYYRLRDRFF